MKTGALGAWFERRLQRRLARHRRLLRLGVAQGTARIVGWHLLLSLTIGMALAVWLDLDARGFRITAAASLGIPLLILTPFAYVTMRLLRDLEAARGEAHRLAVTDDLTQVSNRRHFVAQALLQVEQARRERRPLALAAIDVDHFKRINDAEGHEAGDRVLQRIATRLRESHRPYDLLARMGGDEFALLMPGADGEAALATLERLRVAAGEASLPTLSIGVAVLGPDDDLARLMHNADAALYVAKRRGRDAVALHGEPASA
jgi:diguanylate cyclase (GGDEF)-like protein